LKRKLKERDAELKESREQQAAVSDILRVISGAATDVKPALRTIAEHAMRLCQSVDARVWLVEGDKQKYVTGCGSIAFAGEGHTEPLDRGSGSGRSIIDRKVLHIKDAANASRKELPITREMQRRHGHRTVLYVPLMHEKRALGAIVLRKMVVEPYTKRQIELVRTFADQAAIAIENVRLFNETKEALEQQTATADILRIISGSLTDTQPAFDAIVRNCGNLFEGSRVVLWLLSDDRIHRRAISGAAASEVHADDVPLDRGSAIGACVLDGRMIHLPDLEEAAEQYPRIRQLGLKWGYRSGIYAPLLREGRAIGGFAVLRRMTGAFNDKEVALLKTFADQAVIAIENVRLFKELQARNAEITEALEQQTATTEILKVISSSPTDLKPVFDAILENATRLCDAHMANLSLYDGDTRHAVAQRGGNTEFLKWIRSRGPISIAAGSVHARVIAGRQPLQDADLRDSSDYRERTNPFTIAMVELGGARTRIAVPMLKEGRVVGCITIYRPEVRPFTQKQIDLVSTFASQAVIAIENVRLFNETKEALERQTATADILKVISSSPTDTQPVFDAIVKSGARLFGGKIVSLRLVAGDHTELAASTDPAPRRSIALTDAHSVTVRAVSSGNVVQAPDVLAEEWIGQETKQRARERGFRAIISAPMLKDGAAIGVISVMREAPGPFAEKEIALLQTFADQAVIAIENVRLFKELEARNAEITEALEQQTATAEILKVISSSPTNLQPVFDAILENATRLCDAHMATLTLYDGDTRITVAQRGGSAEYAKWVINRGPIRIVAGGHAARMIAERRPIHIADLRDSSLYRDRTSPSLVALVELGGARSEVLVPMLKEGRVIGGITIYRPEVRPFSQKQIDLVSTFASQAVIAIENVRLFNETKEALEQQTVISEILRVIGSSPTDTQPVFNAIVTSGVHLFSGMDITLRLVKGDYSELVASTRPLDDFGGTYPCPLGDESVPSSRAIQRGEVVQIPDIHAAPDWVSASFRELAELRGFRATMAAPLLRERTTIGGIAVDRATPGPFTDKQIALLKTFADQAVIAIENVRLFKELQARNAEVTEALERQTATSEILSVISQSPTDVAPVFETIMKNAVRLCGSPIASIYRYDGELVHMVANHNWPPEALVGLSRRYPCSPHPALMGGRIVLAKSIVRIPDVLADPDYDKDFAAAGGWRRVVGVPLMRGETPIGAFAVAWPDPGETPENQVALLKTFADQAVIAIENVRLFKELQARNAEITEALEQQTATAEILKVISSSPTDLKPVFDAILDNATRLCDAHMANLSLYDGDTRHTVAQRGGSAEFAQWVMNRGPYRPYAGGVGARMIAERRPVQVTDLRDSPVYRDRTSPGIVALVELGGARSCILVPMLKEGRVVGGITVYRPEVRPFSQKQIDLVSTFASQAVIAIENVRLFNEIQDKSRQLEVASRHKSEFLASMSHELRTPLNAILGFNEMILHGIYGEAPAEMKEPLEDIQASGKHLLHLINNVLDLAKIEAGRMELALTDYSIPDTVERVLSTLRPLAAGKGLEFVVTVPEDIPDAYGDSGRITQCLVNLAGNALKFTKAGKVEISVRHHDGLFTFCVADTGVGIPPDKIGSLFTEFKQTDATIASEYGGTGLGLSITKKFVEMHGGRIWVESEAGMGSRFIFEIPVRATAQAEGGGRA
jgi:GAF domain-containing protein